MVDIDSMAPQDRKKLEELAASMTSAKDGIIPLGKALCSVKKYLRHGEFNQWLSEHCGVSPRKARAWMKVYKVFGKLDPAVAENLSAQTMVEMTYKTCPQGAIDEILDMAEVHPVWFSKAREVIDKHKAAEVADIAKDPKGEMCGTGWFAFSLVAVGVFTGLAGFFTGLWWG